MTTARSAPLIGATAAALVLLLGGAALSEGWSEEGIRVVVRGTAKIAVVLFTAAFSAGSLLGLWRSEATRWMVEHRRGLGLSFALAHTVHLLALVALGLAFPTPFVDDLNPVTLVGGGAAYGFLFAMAATSNDASVRRLGSRWHTLHTIGGWYIWLIFAQSYLPRAVMDPTYLPFGALLLAVPGVRAARAVRARRAAGSPASESLESPIPGS